jgi:hypothetical protein
MAAIHLPHSSLRELRGGKDKGEMTAKYGHGWHVSLLKRDGETIRTAVKGVEPLDHRWHIFPLYYEKNKK